MSKAHQSWRMLLLGMLKACEGRAVCAVAHPVPAPCTTNGRDGTWAVSSWHSNSVWAMGGCHLALAVTTQGDTCIPGCKGRLLTNSS